MSKSKIETAFDAYQRDQSIAAWVTRRPRIALNIAATAILAAGLVLSFLTADFVWFARAGAGLTGISLWHAAIALNHQKLSDIVDAAIKHSGEPNPAVDDSGFWAAVQRKHLIANLQIGAAGTLIWGFGDLLGYVFHG